MMVWFTHPSKEREWNRLISRLGEAVVEDTYKQNLLASGNNVGRAVEGTLSDLRQIEHRGRKERRDAGEMNRRERAMWKRREAAVDPDNITNRNALQKLMSKEIEPKRRSSRKSGRKRANKAAPSSQYDRSILEV